MLDKRLQAVADMVPAGARVADIGTDHAYLAAELWKRGAAAVIASDKNAGPCEAARATLLAEGLSEKISVRQGDGLAVLVPGEADTLCIAGMGGRLIADILAAEPEVTAACRRLVLQPMNEAEALRRWLYANGWYLAEESLAEAAGQLYVILCAEQGEEKIAEDILYLAGPRLTEKKPGLWAAHLKGLIAKEKRAADGMARSEAARATEKYARLCQKIKELEALLPC